MSSIVGFDTSALDPAFKAHAFRGIGRYVRELVRTFESVARSDLRVEFFNHREFRAGAALDKMIDLAPLGRNTIRQQLVYPMKLGRGAFRRFDVLHFPAHMDAPSWSIPPYIITVLDLIPLVCRDLYQADRPGWRFHLARWLELRAIKNAAMVLAISENTARDVQRLLNVPAERIVVTPLGVDAGFFAQPDADGAAVRRRFGIDPSRDIVLYVGGIDQRKNWKGMLRAFRMLLDMRREADKDEPVLVIAGRIEDDRQYPGLRALMRELALDERMILTGFVEDDDLRALLRECAVFYFPSLYEGFGLTPLEAMAAGAAVVSSNRSAMPEVLGDGAVLVDPENEALAAGEINSLLDAPDRRRALAERGRAQAAKFTWTRTGETTLDAYQAFLSRRRDSRRMAV